jgi:hypothetical protein
MKLSDAILLGSTILTPQAGRQYSAETQSDCALGMAAIARGCIFRRVFCRFDDPDRRTLGVEGVFGVWVLQTVPRPCNCCRLWIPRKLRIKDVIAHLFDYHIMAQKDWTLEQLVMWVKKVENDFDPPPASRSVFDDPTLRRFVEEMWRKELEWDMARNLSGLAGISPLFDG